MKKGGETEKHKTDLRQRKRQRQLDGRRGR